MSYLVDNGGYRIDNRGYLRGPGGGYRRAQAASGPPANPLPQVLEVNSLEGTLDFRYDMGEGLSDDLGTILATVGGQTFTLSGGGTAPVLSAVDQAGWPALRSVVFAGSTGNGYYLGDDADQAEWGTDDVCIEHIFQQDNAGGNSTMGKRRNATSMWYVVNNVNSRNDLRLNDTVDNLAVFSDTPNGVTEGDYGHWMWFINFSEGSANGSRAYVNGLEEGSGTDMSAMGALDNADPLHIGRGGPATATTYSGGIVYGALWHRANWFQEGASGPAEWASVAAARYALITAAA